MTTKIQINISKTMLMREHRLKANPSSHDSEEGREVMKIRNVSQPLQQQPQQGPGCSESSRLVHPIPEFLHWRLPPKSTPLTARGNSSKAANGTSEHGSNRGQLDWHHSLHPEEKIPSSQSSLSVYYFRRASNSRLSEEPFPVLTQHWAVPAQQPAHHQPLIH